MARISVTGMGIESGIDIDYEILGDLGNHSVVLTPGGRFPKEYAGMYELGHALVAGGKSVLMWDRPNCGASDVTFEGISESETQAQALVGLLRALDLKNVALAAGSGGSRVTLIAAARAPELVSHLIVWWISGGPISLAQLAAYYCGESATVALQRGMEGVAALPAWAEQIQRNPRNRDYILSWDVDAFVERMQQWAKAYTYLDDSPVPGMTPADFAKLTMPTLVFRSGWSDMSHTRRTSEWVHEMIPQSRFIDPPWPDTEWNDKGKVPNEPGRGRFEDWPKLAPDILNFAK